MRAASPSEATEQASGSDRRERHASSVELESEAFDAALASLSMSVMPDARAAAQRAYDALVPGSHFVVFDVRPIPSGSLRVLNPLVTRFFRWYANWNPNEDVLESVEETFGSVAVEATYLRGAAYRAVATKAS